MLVEGKNNFLKSSKFYIHCPNALNEYLLVISLHSFYQFWHLMPNLWAKIYIHTSIERDESISCFLAKHMEFVA